MTNPSRLLTTRRRARLTTERKNRIRERAGWKCQVCGKDCRPNHLGKHDLDVDHMIPIEFGGSDSDDNLWALCKACHRKKHRPAPVVAGYKVHFLGGFDGRSQFNSGRSNPAMGGNPQAQERCSQAKEKPRMGATYGGGGNEKLPAGTYLAQVTDVKTIETADFKNPEKKVKKFLWAVDYRAKGQQEWQRYSIFSTTEFRSLASIKSPKYEPKIHKLCRAWGLPVPQSKAEADEWDENEAIGKQFRIKVIYIEGDDELIESYLPLKADAEAPQEAPAPAPPAPAPTASAVDGDDTNWDE